jgi:hypothetical protein
MRSMLLVTSTRSKCYLNAEQVATGTEGAKIGVNVIDWVKEEPVSTSLRGSDLKCELWTPVNKTDITPMSLIKKSISLRHLLAAASCTKCTRQHFVRCPSYC